MKKIFSLNSGCAARHHHPKENARKESTNVRPESNRGTAKRTRQKTEQKLFSDPRADSASRLHWKTLHTPPADVKLQIEWRSRE
jgi:hypothetical protein